MRRKYVTKTCPVWGCALITLLFLTVFPGVNVDAASYNMKAPATFQSIKLTEQKQSWYGPFSDFSFTLEGWACSERFSETTISRIREINRIIQPLAEAQQTLRNLEKVLVQMGREKLITLTKSNVENVVYRAIGDTIKKHGFSSEMALIDNADYLSKDSIESGKGGIKTVFGNYSDADLFKNVQNGTPSGIWKVSKMEPDEPSSVVFVAQECYQKADLEAMVNSIVTTAKKLEEVLKDYKDTKKKILALGK